MYVVSADWSMNYKWTGRRGRLSMRRTVANCADRICLCAPVVHARRVVRVPRAPSVGSISIEHRGNATIPAGQRPCGFDIKPGNAGRLAAVAAMTDRNVCPTKAIARAARCETKGFRPAAELAEGTLSRDGTSRQWTSQTAPCSGHNSPPTTPAGQSHGSVSVA